MQLGECLKTAFEVSQPVQYPFNLSVGVFSSCVLSPLGVKSLEPVTKKATSCVCYSHLQTQHGANYTTAISPGHIMKPC